MGCFCIGEEKPVAVQEKPVQQRKRMSLRVDQQTHVKRTLVDTASEGEVYEDYNFGATLGQGGYALVKQAVHKRMNVEVSIKILHLPEAGRRRISMDIRNSLRALRTRKSEAHYKAVAPQADDLNFDDIFNEIIILESLVHPNVVHFYEYFVSGHGDKIFIVSELLKGGSLVDELSKFDSGFPEEDARLVFQGLLEGVAYLHSQGVIHRDLKLENLIFANRNDLTSIRIIDFGLARATFQTLSPASERDGMVVGTPCYAAPETLDGKPYTTTVDCWALGLVLYQLLTGIHPFDNISNMKELFRTIRQGAYTLDIPEFRRVSSEGKDLVKAFLDVDYKRRISCKGALQHRWLTPDELNPAPPRASRLAEVANSMTKLPELRFEPGDIMLNQGERALFMLYIQKGECEVVLDTRRDRTAGTPTYRRLAGYTAGQIVGERAVRLGTLVNRNDETMAAARAELAAPRAGKAGAASAAQSPRSVSFAAVGSASRTGGFGMDASRRSTKKWTPAYRAWRLLLMYQACAKKWVGPRRNASVRATTAVTAVLIQAPQMRWVLQKDPHAYLEMARLIARNSREHAEAQEALASSSLILLPQWIQLEPISGGVGTIINQFERLWQPLMGGCDGSARANRKQREREMEAEKRRG